VWRGDCGCDQIDGMGFQHECPIGKSGRGVIMGRL
jgi:hypothetical protein